MAPKADPYALGLDRTGANHVPLTPLSFIERSAYVYPARPSVVHGARYTWGETYARCRRLASALAQRGIGRATPSRSCCPTSRRCTRRISACRCAGRC